MIIAYDIETRGLGKEFILGSLIQQNGVIKTFDNKEVMWKYILKKGQSEKKRKRLLKLYSHGGDYDFNALGLIGKKGMVIKNFNPFIASYQEEEKDMIHFYDSYSIFRMPLKQLGEMIGKKKLEMPKETETKKLEEYCIRDSEIVMEGIKWIKERLKEQEVPMKHIITISQVAIQYFMNKWRKEQKEYLFEEYKGNFGVRKRIWETKYKEEIHQAIRGGRVESFQYGKHEDCIELDINSSYTKSAMDMRFPDLRTESFRRGNITNKKFFSNIGICKAMIYNEEDELGLLQVRTDAFNHVLKKGQYGIGVWTFDEIKEALKNGHELIKTEWYITYFDSYQNPFKEILEELYKKKKSAKTTGERWFYKQLMNHAFGKMAYKKKQKEIIIDDMEKAEQYLKKNYEILRGISFDWVYQKELEPEKKDYYAPAVTALIYANARINLYKELQKIPKKVRIYCDTDSIITYEEFIDNFDIGIELGEMKVKEKNVDVTVFHRKALSVGEDIRVSGIHKKQLNKKDFEKGKVKGARKIALNRTHEIEKYGDFEEINRDLKDEMLKHIKINEMFQKQRILYDNQVTNVNEFIDEILMIDEDLSIK